MKSLGLFLTLTLMLASSIGNATIYDETGDQAGGVVSLADGNSATFSPFPADWIYFSDDASTDFNPQDAAHIESVIEGLVGFNIDWVGSFEEAGEVDGHTTSVDANFYAVHYDNRELVFGYDLIQSGFTIDDLSHGFSNLRAYTCATGDCPGGFNEVPVPAAAWLFGTGLIGMAGVARKRRLAA